MPEDRGADDEVSLEAAGKRHRARRYLFHATRKVSRGRTSGRRSSTSCRILMLIRYQIYVVRLSRDGSVYSRYSRG